VVVVLAAVLARVQVAEVGDLVVDLVVEQDRVAVSVVLVVLAQAQELLAERLAQPVDRSSHQSCRIFQQQVAV
jgi:hypothetical protein